MRELEYSLTPFSTLPAIVVDGALQRDHAARHGKRDTDE
jgi:hypothetical protein